MNTLIIYTSRYGSTIESVQKLAASIHGNVDVVNLAVEKAPSLASYQIVLIGGPVFAGKVSPIIRRYVQKNSTALASRKIGLFVAALARYERSMEYLLASFPEWIRTQAFSRETLGGQLQLERLTILDRFLLHRFAGIKWSRNHLNPAGIDRMAAAVNRLIAN